MGRGLEVRRRVSFFVCRLPISCRANSTHPQMLSRNQIVRLDLIASILMSSNAIAMANKGAGAPYHRLFDRTMLAIEVAAHENCRTDFKVGRARRSILMLR